MVRRTLPLFAVAGLCLFLTGCYAGRYTGGGWIPSLADRDSKATFGFNVNVPEDAQPNDFANLEFATGQIQYNDHEAKVAIHGEIAEGGINEGGILELCAGGAGCIYLRDPFVYMTGIYWPVPRGQGEPGIFHVWVSEYANTTGFDPPFEQDGLAIGLEGGTYDGYTNLGLLGGGKTTYHPPKD